jgi:small subunit ribosomal protein S3
MGQKVHPHGLRVGIIKDWDSTWYAEKDFAKFLIEDNKLRKHIKKAAFEAGISTILINRTTDKIKITVKTWKPGLIIGAKGQKIQQLTKDIEALVNDRSKKILINIEEIKRPELDAQLVAESIADQLEQRVSFRRAMKQAMGRTVKAGALGIKTAVSGRLGGADMAREEHYHEGTIPLQTLRADIDYGFAEASTTYGKTGVKVWIYKGQILPLKDRDASKPPEEKTPPPRERRDRRDRGDRPDRGDRTNRGNRGDRGDRPRREGSAR